LTDVTALYVRLWTGNLNVLFVERLLVRRKLADVLHRSKLQICVPLVKVKHQGSRRLRLPYFKTIGIWRW